MEDRIHKNLVENGCKVIINDDFEKVYKCGKSFVIKSPSTEFSLLLPSNKLQKISTKIIGEIKPYTIDAGQMIRTNGWSQMFAMHINNQLSYSFPENIIKDINDENIQDIFDQMKDQKKLFMEDVHGIDPQLEFQLNGSKLANRLNIIVRKDLKKINNNKPILCKSKPIFHKYWTSSEGEGLAFKIKTTCIIPNIKEEIDSILNPYLEDGRVSQYNVRYINSKITKNKKYLLKGINLYQKEHNPILNFSIRDKSVLMKKDFMKDIRIMESQFNTTDLDNVKELSIDAFTKFLQWS